MLRNQHAATMPLARSIERPSALPYDERWAPSSRGVVMSMFRSLVSLCPGWAVGLLGSSPTTIPEEPPLAAELALRLESEGQALWSDGNIATVVFEGEAERVSAWLGGELLPLSPIPDSPLWHGTRRYDRLAEGLLSYSFAVTTEGKSHRTELHLWRGSEAPPPIGLADSLQGQIHTQAIDSDRLGGAREVSVYLPPTPSETTPPPVIYMADGASVEVYAKVLEPLIFADRIPATVIVGVHNGGYLGEHAPDFSDYDPEKDLRMAEYLPVLASEHFPRHEEFFCEEVPIWAEDEFGVSDSSSQIAVLGHSNGGRFAATMGIDHPDHFGHVIAFSMGAGESPSWDSPPDRKARFYLAAGTWEQRYHSTTQDFHRALKEAGFHSTFSSRVASHDVTMWQEEFAIAVVQAFARQ